jgi:hypothetical protein
LWNSTAKSFAFAAEWRGQKVLEIAGLGCRFCGCGHYFGYGRFSGFILVVLL